MKAAGNNTFIEPSEAKVSQITIESSEAKANRITSNTL